MPAELDLVPFSALADVNPPGRIAGLRPDSVVSFIPMQDVSETGEWTGGQTRRFSEVKTGFTSFVEGDVLFAKITPCMENGKGAHVHGLVGGVGFGSTEFHILRATAGNHHRFIYHWSQSPALRLKAQAFMIGSAGQQRVQADFFKNVGIPLLPACEQRRIAAILDTLDEAIRRTEQVIAKLQQMKQGLLHDLLTRGVDEHGDLRPPPDEAPHLYKDSALGQIPRLWATGTVRDVQPFDRQAILTGPFGADLGSNDFVAEGVPVLRIGNVQWGYLDLAHLQYIKEEKARTLGRYRVFLGDLLFARQGATTGRNALVDAAGNGALINYHIIRVAVDHARAHPVFLHACFNSELLRRQVDREKGRGTREGVSTATIERFTLWLPPIDEQGRICRILQGHDSFVEGEKARFSKLTTLKHGLLHDLLTGRVRVPTTEVSS